MLGAPRGNAKPQLGEVICEGIVRVFRGQFISVFARSQAQALIVVHKSSQAEKSRHFGRDAEIQGHGRYPVGCTNA